MTGSKILLDTNIVTAWLKGEPAIVQRIDKATEVYLPVIVAGELMYGAMYSSKVQKNLADIGKLIVEYKVLPVTNEVAGLYGRIKAALRQKGRPIPENDIWIAAIAFANNLTLISRDKHFKEVAGLDLKFW